VALKEREVAVATVAAVAVWRKVRRVTFRMAEAIVADGT
jgi:hypothetical protein